MLDTDKPPCGFGWRAAIIMGYVVILDRSRLASNMESCRPAIVDQGPVGGIGPISMLSFRDGRYRMGSLSSSPGAMAACAYSVYDPSRLVN